jgi:uncharacterized metal-binding protein YceD (DUF177 family)
MTNMSTQYPDTDQPWSVPVAIDELPETGMHVSLSADPATREAVARLAGLRALTAFNAEFDLARNARGIAVTGQITATAGQTCVVSLEPMDCEIRETIELLFAPPAAGPAVGKPMGQGDDEDIEPLTGDSIDLGAIAVEFLILGIDPYPRKKVAEFVPPAMDTAESKPFAALAALKAGPKPDLK